MMADEEIKQTAPAPEGENPVIAAEREMQKAMDAFCDNPDRATGDALAAAQAKVAALRAQGGEQDGSAGGAQARVELVSAGKGTRDVAVAAGSRVDALVKEIGWAAGSYSLINQDGTLTPIDGSFKLPAGPCRVMVQQQVTGGWKG